MAHLAPENLPVYWRLQIAGWGAYGAVTAAIASLVIHLPALQSFGQAIALSGVGVGISHLLHHWIVTRDLATRPWPVRVVHVIVLSGILGLGGGVLNTVAGLAPWQASELRVAGSLREVAVVAIHTFNWVTLLIIWSFVYFSLLAMRERSLARLRESELARALQLTELRLLKSQLNPHFLFNALNTVRALIAENPVRAQQAVTQLARTLRYALGSSQDEIVTLEGELTTVEDYLAIESLRFEDRLKVMLEISPETRSVGIPSMLLQILVENAIKHGIAELPHGGILTVRSELHSGTLVLTVENTRPSSPLPVPATDSIGLRNSEHRLRLLFGARATLELDLTHPNLAVARVCIPCTP